jgi:hypothetical protein
LEGATGCWLRVGRKYRIKTIKIPAVTNAIAERLRMVIRVRAINSSQFDSKPLFALMMLRLDDASPG